MTGESVFLIVEIVKILTLKKHLKKTFKKYSKITVQKYLKNISQEKFELMDTQTINYRKVALNTDKTVSALTC